MTERDLDVLVTEMIPTATELVVSVHSWDKASIEKVFAVLGPMSLEARATITVLAAMVPDHGGTVDLLAWSEPHTSHLKVCVRCGASKPYNAFTRDRYKADGYRPNCSACDRARQSRAAA